MIIIYGPPQSGRTTELIRMAHVGGEIIVCQNVAHVRHLADKVGLTIARPISHNEFISRQWFGLRISGFLIDDIELMLAHISRGTAIEGFSMAAYHEGRKKKQNNTDLVS